MRRNLTKSSSSVNSRARRWEITFQSRTRNPAIRPAAVKALLKRVLTDLVYPPPLGLHRRGFLPPPPENVVEVSVLVVKDPEMAEINGQYRNKPKPTDVLSFPQINYGKREAALEIQKLPLGDVVISADTLMRQAEARDFTYGEELLRLLVHGALHLLGYDHEKVPRSEAARMRRIERRIWKKYLAEAPALVGRARKR